jgi:TolA-binding protein
MSEAEQEWFRKELEGNKKLRDEVAFRKKSDLALKNHDIIQLRSKLAEIEKRRATEVPAKSPGKHINMKYAAVIAGFVLIGSVALFTDRNLANDEIFDRYYKSYETPANVRSGEIGINVDSRDLIDFYNEAIDSYNVKDYKNAAKYFNKVLGNDPADMKTTLLYGISNFEVKNYPVAKQSFGKVIKDNNNLYIEDAQWYLAFCYLKTGEQNKAIEQFIDIKKAKSFYSKDARKILREIK